MTKKVAIVGTAPSGINAPFEDKSWDIWGCGLRAGHVCRADRWYELHRLDGEPRPWAIEWRKAMKEWPQDCPIYMFYPEPDLGKEVVKFDPQPLIAKYGTFFMTSSFSWMIAQAIEEGYTDISLWGVDMEYGTEYCLAPETRILTSKLEWVQLSEVKVGDKLIAFDESATVKTHRRWREATVEQTTKLVRPCYRLFMADGSELVSSAEHRWLVNSSNELKWKRTDQLVTNRHRKNRPTRICKPIDAWDGMLIGRDAGYVAASVDGEGWIGQLEKGVHTHTTIGYSQRRNAMSEEFLSAAKRIGYEFYESGEQNGCISYILKGDRKNFLEFLGKVRPHRLLEKFNAAKLGVMRHSKNAVAVNRVEFIGEQPVIGLKTNTGTFIAEGFASHNSHQRVGLRHFIEVAKMCGVNVTRVATSGIAYEPIPYPFWQDDPLLAKLNLRLRKSKELRQEAELTRDGMRVKLERNRGKVEILKELEKDSAKEDFVLSTWLSEATPRCSRYIDGMQSALIDATAQIHKYEGSMEEIQWCEDYLRP